MPALSNGLTRATLGATLLIAPLLIALCAPSAAQQPCNPVIDGTFCAEQMPRARTTTSSQPMISPIRDLGRSISGEPTSPGTLGGINIRSGGQTCIGLLRRGACN